MTPRKCALTFFVFNCGPQQLNNLIFIKCVHTAAQAAAKQGGTFGLSVGSGHGVLDNLCSHDVRSSRVTQHRCIRQVTTFGAEIPECRPSGPAVW